MKIAIVHDQLREFGGAERVLVALKEIYPQADVFTSTFDLNSLGEHKEIVKHWTRSCFLVWENSFDKQTLLPSPF